MNKKDKGKKDFRINILYYLSSMVLFNLVYIIALFSKIGNWFEITLNNIFIYINIIISGILMLIGAVYSICILKNNHNPIDGEYGTIVNFNSIEDLTEREFFGKFSLLVLTGISLANIPLWWGTIVYFLVFVSIGVAYVKLDMLYLNLLLIFYDYKIYKVNGTYQGSNVTEKFYFIVKGKDMSKEKQITYTKTKAKVIRLNNETRNTKQNKSNK